MQLTDLLRTDLDREANRSRRALEQMPEGQYDWKPHEKSMAFGYLSELVATMPSWVTMAIQQDALDLNPAGGSTYQRPNLRTRTDLLSGLDKAHAEASAALTATTDAHLMTPWKLLVRGNVVMQTPRYEVIGETLRHLAHHRGQMTVYLRLLGATVPALYGPSADDKRFQ
jgi:uncharacterized damage-inducible protein DinB